MNTSQYLPLGAAHAHHMDATYYAQWERLRKAQKRALNRALRAPSEAAARAADRALERLTAHENAHDTN